MFIGIRYAVLFEGGPWGYYDENTGTYVVEDTLQGDGTLLVDGVLDSGGCFVVET